MHLYEETFSVEAWIWYFTPWFMCDAYPFKSSDMHILYTNVSRLLHDIPNTRSHFHNWVKQWPLVFTEKDSNSHEPHISQVQLQSYILKNVPFLNIRNLLQLTKLLFISCKFRFSAD